MLPYYKMLFKRHYSLKNSQKLFILSITILSILITAFYNPINIQDDINNKYTNIGNIGLTVTNYGTIGNGFSSFPDQPSCQYPKGSGIENLFIGGIWIGGVKDGLISVSTAAVDVSTSNRTAGFEFTNAPGSTILERSSLQTSPNYRPDAISHQDFVCQFFDTNITYNGTVIQDHIPVGYKVLLETYCYDFNFANNWVILNYKIVNIGYRGLNQPIDSIYVGMWCDGVVRNTNITPPGGSAFYSKGADGYDSTYRMAYEYDYDGDPGFTDTYVAFKLLGVTPRPANENINDKTHFTIWQFRNTTDPLYFSPTVDNSSAPDGAGKYQKLQGYLKTNPNDSIDNPTVIPSRLDVLRHTPSNRSTLVSYGPVRNENNSSYSLRYIEDTLNVVFAVVCAKKTGNDPTTWDSAYQRNDLNVAASWAQSAYDNGYKLPSPPDIPVTKTIIKDKNVTLYWSANAERSIDPISNLEDFEGYRIYRTNPGTDLSLNQDLTSLLNLVGEFDSTRNNVSNNTGFNFIKLDQPKYFDGDTTPYYYTFDFPNQLNGFQYVYSVTAFDKGDISQNLGSLESSILSNAQRVIVGTPSNEDPNAEIGVYPNPYYGNAVWDGSGNKQELLRKIYFFNLPSKCTISIWSLAGDLVDQLYHDGATYNGSDIEWFNTYADGTQKFAGGEHAWDLVTKSDQAIASGLYLFTVEDQNSGEIKKGKFVIVK
ncbi:MAG: hypothetical protein KDD00_02745 [Ignavibacteriae bacterium]|nr:hypothetical protein [Ignavibacteriota bacterium]